MESSSFNSAQSFQKPIVEMSPEEILEDPLLIDVSTDSFSQRTDQAIERDDIQTCLQCRQEFRISENKNDKCNGGRKKAYMGSFYHIYKNRRPGINGPLTEFVSTEPTNRPPTVFSLDAEMIYSTHGSELVRISLVHISKEVVFDYIVSPVGKVYSFHTEYSGVTSEDLVYKMSFEEVRNIFLSTVKSQDIIIGHGLENDLLALKIRHQRVIDTSILDWEGMDIHKSIEKRKPSLKTLAKMILGEEIQTGAIRGHDSTEDALAALNLALAFAGCL
ncbi:UNVERIFIED_CONTAM: hypothetical protein RMT77_000883 [Armadillidium vulgare]